MPPPSPSRAPPVLQSPNRCHMPLPTRRAAIDACGVNGDLAVARFAAAAAHACDTVATLRYCAPTPLLLLRSASFRYCAAPPGPCWAAPSIGLIPCLLGETARGEAARESFWPSAHHSGTVLRFFFSFRAWGTFPFLPSAQKISGWCRAIQLGRMHALFLPVSFCFSFSVSSSKLTPARSW